MKKKVKKIEPGPPYKPPVHNFLMIRTREQILKVWPVPWKFKILA